MGAHLAIGMLRVISALPLSWQSVLGSAAGALLHALARERRGIAERNLQACMPELSDSERAALVREHFKWLGRSIIERGFLWFAPRERIEQSIQVGGDVTFAERSEQPTMWLVPHFLGLEGAAMAVQLCQRRRAATIYQTQSNAAFDAAVRAGRERFGNSMLFNRKDSAKPLIRAIRQEGMGFFNLPDMDFGLKDGAFVPFFGVPAATLLAPSKMARLLNMKVQPVVAEMIEGGGWRVCFHAPWSDFPTDDPIADAARMNAWIEARVRELPAQYLWVHKRFKTRPAGLQSLYD